MALSNKQYLDILKENLKQTIENSKPNYSNKVNMAVTPAKDIIKNRMDTPEKFHIDTYKKQDAVAKLMENFYFPKSEKPMGSADLVSNGYSKAGKNSKLPTSGKNISDGSKLSGNPEEVVNSIEEMDLLNIEAELEAIFNDDNDDVNVEEINAPAAPADEEDNLPSDPGEEAGMPESSEILSAEEMLAKIFSEDDDEDDAPAADGDNDIDDDDVPETDADDEVVDIEPETDADDTVVENDMDISDTELLDQVLAEIDEVYDDEIDDGELDPNINKKVDDDDDNDDK